jgi:hypothetical protein
MGRWRIYLLEPAIRGVLEGLLGFEEQKVKHWRNSKDVESLVRVTAKLTTFSGK